MLDNVKKFTTVEEMQKQTLEFWQQCAHHAVQQRGAFHVALSGGNTPKAVYQALAQSPWLEQLPWSHTHIYFGDERSVPSDHPDSNYRMAKLAMLDKCPIPTEQVHPIRITTDAIEHDALAYAETLRACLPRDAEGIPQFDLILLGMGTDGHTASLFPNTTILNNQIDFAAAVHVPQLDTWRISITYLLINHARSILVLVSGKDKAPIIRDLWQTGGAQPKYPIQRIKPNGELRWFLDSAAAKGMDSH